MNLVLFGVPENRDMIICRNNVDDILKFIAGKDMDIVDLFRLGKYQENRVRPVLVKLRTVWDRRLILNGARKLKEYHQRVYISPDEPLDARRKRIFDRIKYKAVMNGKSVNVNEENGTLVVDGIVVYSLSAGNVTPNQY